MSEKFIYEAIDHTSDEVYYPIGIWHSLDSAIEAIAKWKDDPEALDQFGHVEDYFKVVVRRREIGLHGSEKEVAVFEWEREYPEEGETFMKLITSPEGGE